MERTVLLAKIMRPLRLRRFHPVRTRLRDRSAVFLHGEGHISVGECSTEIEQPRRMTTFSTASGFARSA
jgi:hypothetical protein